MAELAMTRLRFYLAWGCAFLALYGTIFLAGVIVGKGLAMLDWQEAAVKGIASIAQWDFWP